VCLTKPAQVLAVHGPCATVLLDGASVEVDTRPVGVVAPGDYLLVHAGLALERVDPAAAAELEALLSELNAFAEEQR
jgi:hydrogenase expression/formation protein HypC